MELKDSESQSLVDRIGDPAQIGDRRVVGTAPLCGERASLIDDTADPGDDHTGIRRMAIEEFHIIRGGRLSQRQTVSNCEVARREGVRAEELCVRGVDRHWAEGVIGCKGNTGACRTTVQNNVVEQL